MTTPLPAQTFDELAFALSLATIRAAAYRDAILVLSAHNDDPTFEGFMKEMHAEAADTAIDLAAARYLLYTLIPHEQKVRAMVAAQPPRTIWTFVQSVLKELLP